MFKRILVFILVLSLVVADLNNSSHYQLEARAYNCKPSLQWENLVEYDCTNGCEITYRAQVGTFVKKADYFGGSVAEKPHDSNTTDFSSGNASLWIPSLEAIYKKAARSDMNATSDWKSIEKKNWQDEVSTDDITMNIGMGSRVSLLQLVGECGRFITRFRSFKQIEYVNGELVNGFGLKIPNHN